MTSKRQAQVGRHHQVVVALTLAGLAAMVYAPDIAQPALVLVSLAIGAVAGNTVRYVSAETTRPSGFPPAPQGVA